MATTQAVAEVDDAWPSTGEEAWPDDLFNRQTDEQEPSKTIEKTDNSPQPRRQPFRRPRAGRACGSCHSRRIRCDAGSHGVPCTNCTAHSVKCFIPPKKKKAIGERLPAGEMSRKNRGRYNAPQPWLESTPPAVLDTPSDVEIEDNLRSLEEKTIFTGLYGAIAKQNETACFSRKESIDSRSECIQNIPRRISPECRIIDRKDQDEWEPMLVFYDEDKEKGGWMDGGKPGTPAPTGIDVEEWSDIVGLR